MVDTFEILVAFSKGVDYCGRDQKRVQLVRNIFCHNVYKVKLTRSDLEESLNMPSMLHSHFLNFIPHPFQPPSRLRLPYLELEYSQTGSTLRDRRYSNLA